MASVTFPVGVGGDGSTVTDDGNVSTGLANGGHRTRFVPALSQVVAVAGNAVTSATTASTKAGEALASANNAAAAYDAFDDRYLGSKASDPTLDNDGNALLTGALYWSTATSEMKVYSGSAWVAAYLPAGAYATLNGTEIFTNKTLALGSNTVSGTKAQFDSACTDGNFLYVGDSLTDPAITGTILEDVYTITDGAAFEIDPSNGSVQLITLGASRTPKATNFANGEAITLMVLDGTAYALTWTDATFGGSGVVWVGSTAPTLDTTKYTVIELWKVGGQVYGALVGAA